MFVAQQDGSTSFIGAVPELLKKFKQFKQLNLL